MFGGETLVFTADIPLSRIVHPVQLLISSFLLLLLLLTRLAAAAAECLNGLENPSQQWGSIRCHGTRVWDDAPPPRRTWCFYTGRRMGSFSPDNYPELLFAGSH